MTGIFPRLWPQPAGLGEPWGPLLRSVAFWLLASLLVGGVANLLPQAWLQGDSRKARQLGRRRWKRWIPDAGAVLPGGVSKASLVRRDAASLERLLVEIRRAELVHRALLGAGGLPAFWLPPAGGAVNLAFAVAFNLPCLLLQRENRGRVQRCLERLRRRGHSSIVERSERDDEAEAPW